MIKIIILALELFYFTKHSVECCFVVNFLFCRETFNNTGASDRSFYPIYNKRFDHLETLLTIHRPKKVLSAGSLFGPLVPSPSLNAPKRPLYYPKSVMLQIQICYHSHLNVSQKTKTNINFIGHAWVRTTANCWIKGFILPHKYHAPNCCRRFCHTLAN